MVRCLFGVVRVVVALSCAPALAGIPEPDAVLYGPATISGTRVTQADPVTVIARVVGVPDPVGVYRFGEPGPSNCVSGTPSNDCNHNCIEDACDISCSAPGCSAVVGCGTSKDAYPTAGGDGMPDECPGDNYVLRIRLEHLLPGETQSPNAAQIGQAVNLYLKYEDGPEQLAGSAKITVRGMLRELVLPLLTLSEFVGFRACMAGPANTEPSKSCVSLDYDQDHDVDLVDFALFQSSFGGQ